MLKFVAVAAFLAVASGQYINAPLSYARPLAYSGVQAAPLLTRYAAPASYVSHAPVAVAHAPLAVAHAPVAVAHAPIAYSAPAARIDEHDPHPQYSYSYSVNDATTGDNKEQHESRDGDVVQGSYSLVEADGSRRIVDYTADPINGFNANVHKEAAVAHAPVAYAAPAPILRAAPAIATYAHAAPAIATYAHAPTYSYASPAVTHIAHAPVGTVGHSSPVLHL